MRANAFKNFFLLFAQKLRLSNPWNYKAPFLITVPYFIFFINPDKTSVNPLFYIIISLFVIIGVAGIGYLTNDLGDKKKDKMIGKQNSTDYLKPQTIGLLFFFFFTLIVLPWFFLPFNKNSFILLFIEIALFFMYALPPFRLKEKGFMGILTDTLYAHVIPAVLSSYTFYLLMPLPFHSYQNFLLTIVIWQFLLGIRNIIFHQLQDFEKDISSGTQTFVTGMKFGKAEFLVKNILLPFEIGFFVLFLHFCGLHYQLLIAATAIYWLVNLILNGKQLRQLGYRKAAYLFLDDWYIKWIPLLVLGIISLHQSQFLIVFILHFLLFPSVLKSLLQKLIKR